MWIKFKPISMTDKAELYVNVSAAVCMEIDGLKVRFMYERCFAELTLMEETIQKLQELFRLESRRQGCGLDSMGNEREFPEVLVLSAGGRNSQKILINEHNLDLVSRNNFGILHTCYTRRGEIPVRNIVGNLELFLDNVTEEMYECRTLRICQA